MMAKNLPAKLVFKRVEQSIEIKQPQPTKVIDEAYKEFFKALFKIKDKEVHRRVIQAVNGQELTCAKCANTISMNGLPSPNIGQMKSTQTLAKDFEFLEKTNSSTNTNRTTSPSNDCFILNKIQLGRAKRKFEPYAVKAERDEPCIIPNKINYLRHNYEPDSLLVSNK